MISGFFLLATLGTPALAFEVNENDAAWRTALAWRLNRGGSVSAAWTNLDDVESLFLDAYDAWEAPTCTSFEHDYKGRTNFLSSANANDTNTHGFVTSGWAQKGWGDPTVVIGITVQRFQGFQNTWELYETDVSFNEQQWEFVDGRPRSLYEADLLSIAVHEFGHSLGLDHSASPASSMYASYDGTTNGRTLHSDDVAGVCHMYPSGTPLPSDDAYEDNDDPNDAKLLACGEVIQAKSVDADWFYVITDQSSTLGVTLDVPAQVNLDTILYQRQGQYLAPVARGTEGVGVDEVLAGGTQAAGTYYVLVEPVEGTGAYELQITCAGGAEAPEPVEPDAYEQNDDNAQAVALDCPGTYELTAEENDEDWFLVFTEAEGDVSARVTWSASGLDLDLYLVDTVGVVDASEQELGTEEAVGPVQVGQGTYGVVVSPFLGEGAYTLELACSGNPDPVAPTDSGLEDTGVADDTGDVFDEEDLYLLCGCAAAGPSSSGLGVVVLGLLLLRRREDRGRSATEA